MTEDVHPARPMPLEPDVRVDDPDPEWLAVIHSPDLEGLDEYLSARMGSSTLRDLIEGGAERLTLDKLGEIYPSLLFHAARVTDPVIAAGLAAAIDTFHAATHDGCEDDLYDLISGMCEGIAEAIGGRYIAL